ncbi:MAG: beta family protein, partial [Tannerellaceae bacterium]|nr:beta family protein [Tannerellaceae bacterium]
LQVMKLVNNYISENCIVCFLMAVIRNCKEKSPNDRFGIKNASDGASPGSSPSFWISVRMNIHIEQQLKRLSEKTV